MIPHSTLVGTIVVTALVLAAAPLDAAPQTGKLLVGWSSASITPDLPMALSGQFHTRISKSVHDPLTATALAIEVRSDKGTIDHAILVSCDVVAIRPGIQQKLRDRLAGKLPDVDLRKVILNATHTHTGPVLDNVSRKPPRGSAAKPSLRYHIPKTGVIQVDDYVDFFMDRLSDAVITAWRNRAPAGVSWAFSHAVVGHNRRAVFDDGSAVMYAKTDSPHFRNIEGTEDHGVELLFFWDQASKLTGIAVNLACPSQVVEGESYVSADFWHDVRLQLRKAYSKDLFILPLCSAAGDQSPHLLLYKQAEATLRKRKGISETEEIGRRIAHAVDCVFDGAKGDVHTEVPFTHCVEDLKLPARRVSQAEADRAKKRVEDYRAKGIDKLSETERTKLAREQGVLAWFANQTDNVYPMELHVLRLGDVAIATNPFELFLDFGLRIQARSRAAQTFVVQLACDSGGYLPTEKAVQAGGYGAEPPSNEVGPEGGRLLVERTVTVINSLWPPRK